MSSKLYSKQQKWRESHDKKLSTARAAVTAATDAACTFQPTFTSSSTKSPSPNSPNNTTGPTSTPLTSNKSTPNPFSTSLNSTTSSLPSTRSQQQSADHIARYQRARVDKQTREKGTKSPKDEYHDSQQQYEPPRDARSDVVFKPLLDVRGDVPVNYGDTMDVTTSAREGESGGDYDEDNAFFYDQLERERGEWAAERKQLLNVIAIQQKEIAAQNGLARERAVEVARTFGDAVGVFEQRIIGVENGVMTELKLLRSRISSSVTGRGEKEAEVGEKMAAIEKKMDWLCMTMAPNN